MERPPAMTDVDREARARARLALVLAELAQRPDDEELITLARRLTDVVECYDFHRHMTRTRLALATWRRRN
jgi:hypothetical protein